MNSNKKILIIEDDELIIKLLKFILEKEGYSVKCTLKGLGEIQAIRDIFIRHTRAGLDRLSEIQA